MELDNSSTPAGTPSEDRRKSGRMTRRPDTFSQSTHSALEGGKRKRGDVLEPGGDDDMSDSESDGSSEDDAADEEELKAKKRAARKARSKKPAAKKVPRAAKKPKVVGNGLGKQLAFRPALNGRLPASRPRMPKVRPSLAAGEHGLYGMSPNYIEVSFFLITWK